MIFTFVLVSLFVGSFGHGGNDNGPIINIDGESDCQPIININGFSSTQPTNKSCDKQIAKLLSNITNILNEHARRVEAILGTIDSTSRARDCQDIQRQGYKLTGVYTIYPAGTVGFPVRCDMDTGGGGWTVFQLRVSDSDFYKTWNEYQIGFGNLSGNFWLGNQQIHSITKQGWYELRVDLVSLAGEAAYAEYNVFSVGDIGSMYKLTVDGYSGNAGDSLTYHNGMKFSTKDKDNDRRSGQCAQSFTGAWWYNDCHYSNLNGIYGAGGNKGPRWHLFKDTEPMQKTEMKFRRWRPSVTDILRN